MFTCKRKRLIQIPGKLLKSPPNDLGKLLFFLSVPRFAESKQFHESEAIKTDDFIP